MRQFSTLLSTSTVLLFGLCCAESAGAPSSRPSSATVPAAWLLFGAPLLEETVFRAGLHEALLRHLGGPVGRLFFANALTALTFALAHLAQRPGPLAALTLLPALLIGRAYERNRRIFPCVALHASFNAVWLLCSA